MNSSKGVNIHGVRLWGNPYSTREDPLRGLGRKVKDKILASVPPIENDAIPCWERCTQERWSSGPRLNR